MCLCPVVVAAQELQQVQDKGVLTGIAGLKDWPLGGWKGKG